MILHTEKEIEAKVRQVFKAKYEFYGLYVELTKVNDGWDIKIFSEFEPPGLSFSQLAELSDFFNTKAINESSFAQGGCETCDYGSKYGFVLTVRPEIHAPIRSRA